MTQGQAVLLALAFLLALSATVGVCIVVTALRYELQARLRARRRRVGMIVLTPHAARPAAPIPAALETHSRYRQNRNTAA